MKKNFLSATLVCLIGVFAVFCLPASAQTRTASWRQVSRITDNSFFLSDEAARVASQVMLYQRVTGGWPKNIDFARKMSEPEKESVRQDFSRRDDSTTDNNATSLEMNFLARMYNATGKKEYREAVVKGIDYLLSGQYASGGWPQFWPEMRDYQIHITYNDDAMANTMLLLRRVRDGLEPYNNDYADEQLKKRITESLDRAVDCILKTQIVYRGELTVWCQQHDRETFLPAPARAYELPSFCTQESATILALLMDIENPDKRVKRAIHAAIKWFDRYKLTGLRLQRSFNEREGMNTELIADPEAQTPIWARYYDLEHCEPYVCDRDGIPRRHLTQIGFERRNGYSWYNTRALDMNLFEKYELWAEKYDRRNKVRLDVNGKGANETGLIQLDRKPVVNEKAFDVVVRPGQSIQAAIASAPEKPAEPFKILIKKGTYNEKVILDRPNLVLVGEERDETILTIAEKSGQLLFDEYRGQPVGNGVICLQEGADDCVISGLTVYNNYGSTVENTTTHQMAIFGRATRTIVINCNVWADGNDALSLWAKGGGGMYYHADLNLRCPGVDFLCPRGWCYATRCSFYGDGRAIIWHDGRGDKNQKLVITNSTFDAKSPTMLGRYHHDHQFFIANCKLSANILDTNISYAYSDKVLDPCPWGFRVYYWGCTREGGDSGWLRNNLNQAPGNVEYHTLTARWTFDDQWNPEALIRSLWPVLAY